MFDWKEKEMRQEALDAIIDVLESGYNGYYCDLHDEVFNTDYYIIGTAQSEETLAEFGVFKAIDRVQTFERDNFGVTYTDVSNPEKLVNMLFYIIGEEVLYGRHYDVLSRAWDRRADPDTNAELIDALQIA